MKKKRRLVVEFIGDDEDVEFIVEGMEDFIGDNGGSAVAVKEEAAE